MRRQVRSTHDEVVRYEKYVIAALRRFGMSPQAASALVAAHHADKEPTLYHAWAKGLNPDHYAHTIWQAAGKPTQYRSVEEKKWQPFSSQPRHRTRRDPTAALLPGENVRRDDQSGAWYAEYREYPWQEGWTRMGTFNTRQEAVNALVSSRHRSRPVYHPLTEAARRRGVPRGDVSFPSSTGGRSVVVTSRGMLPGYWKIELSDGTLVESSIQSKTYALDRARRIAERGEFDAGISGFPRWERL